MKEIVLSKGQVALVDDEDFEWLNQHKWYAWWSPRGRCYYAARTKHIAYEAGKRLRKVLYMHREILGLQPGDRRQGDHIDPAKTLNNQRNNLRIANRSQQNANKRVRKDSTTGMKGICRVGNGFKVRIRKTYIGFCRTPEAAHDLYVQAAQEHFGEFARTA